MKALFALSLLGPCLSLPSGQARAEDGPRYDLCYGLDQNGRPLPNPNASFGCSQLEFLRQSCENLERATNAPVLNTPGCVNFHPGDVRARPGSRNPASQSTQTPGGSR